MTLTLLDSGGIHVEWGDLTLIEAMGLVHMCELQLRLSGMEIWTTARNAARGADKAVVPAKPSKGKTRRKAVAETQGEGT